MNCINCGHELETRKTIKEGKIYFTHKSIDRLNIGILEGHSLFCDCSKPEPKGVEKWNKETMNGNWI